MDMQKELMAEYDRELAATRKMLDAIPADADLNWKSNPKCMTLGRLAGHVAETVERGESTPLQRRAQIRHGQL